MSPESIITRLESVASENHLENRDYGFRLSLAMLARAE
jgi:hypothetical protein